MINPKKIRDSFHLPIETAVLVPSTTKADKPLTKKDFQKRIDSTRRYLSKLFGGYTSIQAIGGYVSNQKGLIQEQVVMVVSYAQEKDFNKNETKFLNWARRKGKQWSQESIGIIIENDLYYLATRTTTKQRIGKV